MNNSGKTYDFSSKKYERIAEEIENYEKQLDNPSDYEHNRRIDDTRQSQTQKGAIFKITGEKPKFRADEIRKSKEAYDNYEHQLRGDFELNVAEREKMSSGTGNVKAVEVVDSFKTRCKIISSAISSNCNSEFFYYNYERKNVLNDNKKEVHQVMSRREPETVWKFSEECEKKMANTKREIENIEQQLDDSMSSKLEEPESTGYETGARHVFEKPKCRGESADFSRVDKAKLIQFNDREILKIKEEYDNYESQLE